MNCGKTFFRLLLAAILGMVAVPAGAEVFFQCPGLDATVDQDVDGDGMLRAYVPGEISAPIHPSQVCMHLVSGDGFVNMADKTLDHGPDAPVGAGYSQYIFGFANATVDDEVPLPRPVVPDNQVMGRFMLKMNFSAPTILLNQGDQFYLSLSNVGMMMRPDLFDPHSVHYHGFPNASAIFDGLPDSGIAIMMGSTLTYFYNVVEPGTVIYHCHVEAAEHMQMGMLGNLFVRSGQDGTTIEYPLGSGRTFSLFAYNDVDGSTGYDVDFPIQIAGFDPAFHDASINVQPLPFAEMDDIYPMLNGRGYPDTVNPAELPNSDGSLSQKVNSLITATVGQRILLRISSLSTTSVHTLAVQGIPMLVVGKDARKLGLPNDATKYYLTSSVTLGGGETYDVILDTVGIAPGTYFLYSTNLNHLNNRAEEYGGMMTEIRISAAGPI
jgi:FtsP/CotA-like multicopper oxidase with cupredoxin domain